MSNAPFQQIASAALNAKTNLSLLRSTVAALKRSFFTFEALKHVQRKHSIRHLYIVLRKKQKK